MNDKPTAVYRHFDKDGVLLYVGLSSAPERRIMQHSRSAGWFSQVADVKVEWHPNRDAARAAELAAIADEKPMFNVQRETAPLKLSASNLATERFLKEKCGSVDGVVHIIGKYFNNVPRFATVQKWFYRKNIPGEWWPVLICAVAFENGERSFLMDYFTDEEGGEDDVFA